MPGVRIVIFAFAFGMFFGGIFNVVELPFATGALGTDVAGYSLLVAVYGVGFIIGSLQGVRGGGAPRLKRRYLQGLLLTGVGSVAAGASFELGLALAAFAVGGYGNGLAVVHQRLLFQSEVASSLQGRVFAVTDSLLAWGFAVGFLAAGALATVATPRTLLLIVGGGELVLAAVAALALRRHWVAGEAVGPGLGEAVALGSGADALGNADVRQQRSHLVDGAGFWLTLLDDLREGGDDVGVELGPRIPE